MNGQKYELEEMFELAREFLFELLLAMILVGISLAVGVGAFFLTGEILTKLYELVGGHNPFI